MGRSKRGEFLGKVAFDVDRFVDRSVWKACLDLRRFILDHVDKGNVAFAEAFAVRFATVAVGMGYMSNPEDDRECVTFVDVPSMAAAREFAEGRLRLWGTNSWRAPSEVIGERARHYRGPGKDRVLLVLFVEAAVMHPMVIPLDAVEMFKATGPPATDFVARVMMHGVFHLGAVALNPEHVSEAQAASGFDEEKTAAATDAAADALGGQMWRTVFTVVPDTWCSACGKARPVEPAPASGAGWCCKCRAVWYCCKACQRGDWARHKTRCVGGRGREVR